MKPLVKAGVIDVVEDFFLSREGKDVEAVCGAPVELHLVQRVGCVREFTFDFRDEDGRAIGEGIGDHRNGIGLKCQREVARKGVGERGGFRLELGARVVIVERCHTATGSRGTVKVQLLLGQRVEVERILDVELVGEA